MMSLRWMVRLQIWCSVWLVAGFLWIGVFPVSSTAWHTPTTTTSRSTATSSWITPHPRNQWSTMHQRKAAGTASSCRTSSSVARIKGNRYDGSLLALLADASVAEQASSLYYFGTERTRIQDTTANSTGTMPTLLVRQGPDPATKPNYHAIVGPLGRTVDHWFLQVFRSKLAAQVGWDSPRNATDYLAVTELALALNQLFSYNTTEVQQRSIRVLLDLFPSWLPRSYAVLFSRPFPQFAARMNAWATWVAGTWLMGECKINDLVIVVDDSPSSSNNNNAAATTTTKILRGQGLLVQRCRFLEEAGCASVCVHACQIPTQTFFQEHMGLPLRMEPNYDTFECQFSFGLEATTATNAAARATPCLARCAAAGSLRQNHPSGMMTMTANIGGVDATTDPISINGSGADNEGAPCAMMGDAE